MEHKLTLFNKLEDKINRQADKITRQYAKAHGHPDDAWDLRNACLMEAWKIIQEKDIIEETAEALFSKSFKYILRRHVKANSVRMERQFPTDEVDTLAQADMGLPVSDAAAEVAECIAALDNPKLRAFACAYMDGASSLAEAGREAGMKSSSEIKRATAALRTIMQEIWQKKQKKAFSADHSAVSRRSNDEAR